MTITTATGDTIQFQITITDVDGDAVNITGATVYYRILDRNGDVLHLQTITSHTSPTTGLTNILVDDSDNDFPVGCYNTMIECSLPSGENWTVRQDQLEVTP